MKRKPAPTVNPIAISSRRRMLAEMSAFRRLVREQKPDNYQGNTDEEDRAERLAQAAPALLAACKLAIEWSKMGPMDFPAETLLAAIAEAEGDDGLDQEN